MVGDGGDVDDDACSTDSFSGFLDPGGQFAITNESVHYHHRSGSHLLSDGYSCHGRVEQVKLNGNLSQSFSVSVSSIIPPWVHVFAKSTKSTSLRTQAASIAYIEEPLHKKARHLRNRRAKKKEEKQHRLLTEVIVPESITPNLLTDYDIYNDIVVVDGDDLSNPYRHCSPATIVAVDIVLAAVAIASSSPITLIAVTISLATLTLALFVARQPRHRRHHPRRRRHCRHRPYSRQSPANLVAIALAKAIILFVTLHPRCQRHHPLHPSCPLHHPPPLSPSPLSCCPHPLIVLFSPLIMSAGR